MELKTGFLLKRQIEIKRVILAWLVMWPLVWNLWNVFKITSSIKVHIPILCLWGMTTLLLFCAKTVIKSFLMVWVAFVGIVVAESFLNPMTVLVDISVVLCGALICMVFYGREIDYYLVIRIIILCGLFVAVFVIIDMKTGMFRNDLIDYYTEAAVRGKLRIQESGGILPHTGSAGGYIYYAIFGCIALLKRKRKDEKVGLWIAGFVLGMGAILVRKRGFIVDSFFAYICIFFFRMNKEKKRYWNFSKRRMICFVTLGVIILTASIKIPFLQNAVYSLVEKATSSNDPFSGRLSLYSLAFSLFQKNYLTGIGWGNYRANTEGMFGKEGLTYEVHNVYIQLLCETGIIGFFAFLGAVALTLSYGIRKYRKVILDKGNNAIFVIELGLVMQLFFLAYCMTGNPLYDYNFCMSYFFGVLFTLIPLDKKRYNCIKMF